MRRLNVPALRGFLMAALHWPPQVVSNGVTLRDIHEAYTAWQQLQTPHDTAPEKPDRAFMQHMMQKFPDTARHKE